MTEETAPAPEADTAPIAATPAPDWRAAIPEDIRADPNFTKYETAEGFYKGHLSLVKMLGADKVAIPKDGDEDGWNRFYEAAGRPKTPEEYGFKQPEQIPEGMVYSAELDQRIAAIAHKRGLNRQQAAGMREDLMAIVAEGATESLSASQKAESERSAAVQAGEQALRQEWGAAFEQRGKVAGAAINKFLSPETIAVLDAAGVANNPAIVRDMYTLGVKLAGEKELIGASQQSQSPGDLDAAIASFRDTHQTALFDKSHPDHAVRTAEFTRLFERRFPEPA